MVEGTANLVLPIYFFHAVYELSLEPYPLPQLRNKLNPFTVFFWIYLAIAEDRDDFFMEPCIVRLRSSCLVRILSLEGEISSYSSNLCVGKHYLNPECY